MRKTCVLLAFLTFAFNLYAQRPNIILINVDDLGWRDVGFMGSNYYETPNIDRLVGKGLVFTNGYAAASNCAPSRASMISGLFMNRHGVYTVSSSERGKAENRKLIPIKNRDDLDTKFKTMPQTLHDAGYTTCIAGKWHLSKDPKPFGFDVNIGGSDHGSPKSYYPPYNLPNIEESNKYLTDFIMDKTLEFVEQQDKNKPFFLYYSTYAVHSPIQKIDSLMYKFKDKPEDNGQKNASYATMVNNEDRNIGRMIALLEEKGLMENTLIVFTSDNGGFNKVTWQRPLRAGKGSYFEGGVRVPLAFIWKGKITPGKTDLPVTNLDFYPTFASFAHAKTPALLDGNSIADYLTTQKSDQTLENRSLYWYFPIYLEAGNKETNDMLFRTRPGEILRKGYWKIHHYFEDDSYQLYNLKADIGEKNNLANSQPAKLRELQLELKRMDKLTKAPAVTQLNPKYAPTNN